MSSNENLAQYHDSWAGGRPHHRAALLPSVLRLGIERYIVHLAIFLSPFLNLRTDALFFTLSDGLYVLALAIMVARGRLPRSPLGIVTIIWLTAFALIAGGLGLSSLLIGDSGRGIAIVLQYFFCFMLLPFVILQGDEDEAYRLLLTFVLGVVALDLHGIIAYATVGYSPSSVAVTGSLRLATLVGNPNGAGCLNAMMVVTVLWLRSAKRISLPLALCFLGVMITAVVLTSSNTSLIATTMGVLLFLVSTFRPSLLLKLLPLAVLAALFFQNGGLEYLPATFQRRVLAAMVSGEISEAGTFVSRSALMWESLEMIGNRGFNLLGIGADQFRVHSVQETPVHNTYLLLWVEGGIFALLGWLLLIAMGLFLWLLARRQRVVFSGGAAVLACFAVFAVVAAGSTHIYARFWYTALLLVMQPTLIILSRAGRPATDQTGTV